jgi:hypothetical protein
VIPESFLEALILKRRQIIDKEYQALVLTSATYLADKHEGLKAKLGKLKTSHRVEQHARY